MRPVTALLAVLALASAAAAAPAPAPPANDFSACQARYSAIGLPAMKADEEADGSTPIALCRQGYAVLFDPETRDPYWVIERLERDWLTGNAVRKDNFLEDADANRIQPNASAKPSDYNGQHYDRGHQAPAGDFKSSQDMTNKSFLMTNMAPQIGIGFNRNIWKDLETDVRSWVACGGMTELYVITGPVFGDNEKFIGPSKDRKVRVPDKFFKVIYDPVGGRALGMLLPNAKLNSADLPSYAVPISQIEEETGITFFPALSRRQQNVLKTSAGNLWQADASCSSAETGD